MKKAPTRRDFIGTALAAAGIGLSTNRTRGDQPNSANPSTFGGLEEGRLIQADRLIAARVESGELSAAAFLVRRNGFEFARAYGKAGVHTPFLIASITKPMTASAAMFLRDRRQLQLSDRVEKYLPSFSGGDRELVTIKHLLTHTSGLPDMLPENVELRKKHAPLGEFVDRACRTRLLFRPGSKVRYQSMGFLLLGAIVEAISRQSLRSFLAENIFTPLKMGETSLGLGGRRLADMAMCQVGESTDWNWNSIYWRDFGAPWGGAHSTVHDLATFIGRFTELGNSPWNQETRREMRTVQTTGMSEAWGLGWSCEPRRFARSCSKATFGHTGASGTVVWRDPESDLTCVQLTTWAESESGRILLAPVSELVAQARSRA